MKARFAVLVAIVVLFLATSAFANDERDERVLKAVKGIVNVQFESGEQGAIGLLRTCYGAIPPREISEKLEECIAQDIAYANLSAGMYRNVLKSMKQPEYPSLDAMQSRVYGAAKSAGMADAEADKYLRQLAPIATASLSPAINSRTGAK